MPTAVELAKPCLLCRKRRVRCDGAKPQCNKCAADDKACPGYKEALRVIAYAPSVTRHRKRTMKRPMDPEVASPPRLLGDAEGAAIDQILQAVDHHNRMVDKFADNNLFKPTRVPGDVLWLQIPTLFKYLYVVVLRSMHTFEQGGDPSHIPLICQYRGLAFRSLRSCIAERTVTLPSEDPGMVLLRATLMLMIADVLCDSHDDWKQHHRLAKSILCDNGGIECLVQFQDSRTLIVSTAVIDTLQATTLPPHRLSRLDQHPLILPKSFQHDIFQIRHGFPRDLLNIMAEINAIRARVQHESLAPMSSDHHVARGALKARIVAFDPASWAAGVLDGRYKRPLRPSQRAHNSEMTSLTSVGHCCKSACLLFLLLSLGWTLDETALQPAYMAQMTLCIHAKHLLGSATNKKNDPSYCPLWTTLGWPLFVSAYAEAGWGIRVLQDTSETERFCRFALQLGYPSLLETAKNIVSIAETQAGKSMPHWNWGDGLHARAWATR